MNFKCVKYRAKSKNMRTKKVDLQIQCAMYDYNGIPSGFYIYPRSSISKTPFRLANNVGIIDSGYRGNLGACFDYYSNRENIKKKTFFCYRNLKELCSKTSKAVKL